MLIINIKNNMNTQLEFSTSGRLCRIFHENGRLIAEFLVHGPLAQVAQNCDNLVPIVQGRLNVFRAEVWRLAGYEYLDLEGERITER